MITNNNQKKLIVILGAGESGTGAAVLAKTQGFDVFVSDYGEIKQKYIDVLNKYNIEWEQNKHTVDKIVKANEVIKSPGISNNIDIIKEIKDRDIKIISEIEFAARYTSAVKVCVTGSNGKTTTTSLIYHILSNAGLNVGIAGNIGKSFAYQVALKKYDYYVIELSSFQLDDMFDFKADLAILLNITPDHLDRYDYKLQNYINSKFRITRNQKKKDHFIYCSDDEIIMKELESRNLESTNLDFTITKKTKQGAYIENKKLKVDYKNEKFSMLLHDLALQGKHNTYNSMAAAIASKVLNIKNENIRESLMDFKNIEHRLEPVLSINKIQFINDSKATNVNSTWYALESISTKIVWIVGGIDKGNDYSLLINLVKQKVKAIICLGVDNKNIHNIFGNIVDIIEDTQSMQEAVKLSYKYADKGDTVLLSPACASFDLFDNYEDRGLQFKMAVRNL